MIVGFGDYNDDHYVDRLFTHKDYQGEKDSFIHTTEVRKRSSELGAWGDIYRGEYYSKTFL